MAIRSQSQTWILAYSIRFFRGSLANTNGTGERETLEKMGRFLLRGLTIGADPAQRLKRRPQCWPGLADLSAAGSSAVQGLIHSSAQPVAGSSPRRNGHCGSNPSTSSAVVRTSEPWQR